MIATAGKPLNFTIKAFHNGTVSDPDTFTAAGAIEDSGFYTVEWFDDEELFPAGWYLFEFASEQGTFLAGWVPEFAHNTPDCVPVLNSNQRETTPCPTK